MKHGYRAISGPIVIAPMAQADSELYRLLRNREENRKWFGSHMSIPRAAQERWYRTYEQDESCIMFAIRLASTGEFIGGNSIYNINRMARQAEYGRLIVNRDFSGNSYGYHATLAALEVCKEDLSLDTVILEVYSDNIAAIRTYEKAGFVPDESRKCVNTSMISMVARI